ncbi:predicted protein [Chaetomium globosum CBS 148.51]|uniref:ABM domain-containing protein n=1 Tax=Chaetomium globosum (strain ATCC 6205 / CBS 148.51 / DSM 1962 / NBRC 6347 / NRRL 1970) TaxID=306901 RepID=Q2GZS6_CHAGB|nr:uncharacterized protein CHGG_04970 [Chaetomium globosum CBS 148.51]EAQ88351.1 predicted protein [Chaetomium globosum CBS 148.51]
MARTKQTARRTYKPFITWTRFQLPREQEWPTWTVDHDDVHAGPLTDVEGCRILSLGRMVDNPEQAAYIIRWRTLDDFLKFQSSPACTAFLDNLPSHANNNNNNNNPEPTDPSSALSHLTLDDTSPLSPPPPSRFQILQHATEAATPEASGLVTLTTFLVPHHIDDKDKYALWQDQLSALDTFCPPGAERLITTRYFWQKGTHVWYWLVGEDGWVWERFGRPADSQDGGQGAGRAVFCHFFLWSPHHGGPEEYEAAVETERVVAVDPKAREAWARALERVVPPATAWVQERWDVREVPRFFPPEPEFDPEDPEYKRELGERMEEFLESRGFKGGERSQ